MKQFPMQLSIKILTVCSAMKEKYDFNIVNRLHIVAEQQLNDTSNQKGKMNV